MADTIRVPGPAVARRRAPRVAHWWFLAPAVALFLAFFAYPLVMSLLGSFQGREHGVDVWVGLRQYERLLQDPSMLTALVNVGVVLLIQVPLMMLVAVLLAVALNLSWLRFRATLRVAYFLPAVTTLVAYALVFRVLLNTDGGVVNQMLGVLGVAPVDWLNDPLWARLALVASLTWRWAGFNMIIVLAGLQGIAKEQYEAARMDGAGPARTFVSIVLPQLKPVLLFCAITSTIGTLQLFDEPLVLTGGGPANATLTPVLYLYRVGFQQLDFGYASAIAWVLVLVIGALAALQWRLMGGRDE